MRAGLTRSCMDDIVRTDMAYVSRPHSTVRRRPPPGLLPEHLLRWLVSRLAVYVGGGLVSMAAAFAFIYVAHLVTPQGHWPNPQPHLADSR